MPDFPADPLSDHAADALERATSPKYRLQPDETAAAGVRRVALGRIDSAVGHLRRETDDDPIEAIHETRKDLKKVRSLLRLVRKRMGAKRFRRENRRYRQAGRALGRARDAQVRLETLAGLQERFGSELPDCRALRARLEAQRDSAAVSAETIEGARGDLAAGAQALDALDLEDAGFDLFRHGLERQYGRGRKALRRVAADPNPEAVHEWRKRVKDLWYHLRLLRNAWPAGLKGTEKAAHELSDLLGDHHDLAVLNHALAKTPADRALEPWIKARQAELLDDALPLGRRLYAEKPKRFAARVGRYWQTREVAAR